MSAYLEVFPTLKHSILMEWNIPNWSTPCTCPSGYSCYGMEHPKLVYSLHLSFRILLLWNGTSQTGLLLALVLQEDTPVMEWNIPNWSTPCTCPSGGYSCYVKGIIKQLFVACPDVCQCALWCIMLYHRHNYLCHSKLPSTMSC